LVIVDLQKVLLLIVTFDIHVYNRGYFLVYTCSFLRIKMCQTEIMNPLTNPVPG